MGHFLYIVCSWLSKTYIPVSTRRWHVYVAFLCVGQCGVSPFKDQHLVTAFKRKWRRKGREGRRKTTWSTYDWREQSRKADQRWMVVFFLNWRGVSSTGQQVSTQGSGPCSGRVILCHAVFQHDFLFCLELVLKWATAGCSPLSTSALCNKPIPPTPPRFSPSLWLHLVLPFEPHHSFVTLSTPLSASIPLPPSSCSNQCLWWIIHSERWGLKLFDWQLYSPVCYIINIPPLGIVAMVRAIMGQGRVSSLMHCVPFQSHTPHLSIPPSVFPFVLSFPPRFGLSSWRSLNANSTHGWTNQFHAALWYAFS